VRTTLVGLVGISGGSIAFNSLLAVDAIRHSYPTWVPVSLVLLGIGIASIVPILGRNDSIPDFLVHDSAGYGRSTEMPTVASE
jgi:hypothetical protein